MKTLPVQEEPEQNYHLETYFSYNLVSDLGLS